MTDKMILNNHARKLAIQSERISQAYAKTEERLLKYQQSGFVWDAYVAQDFVEVYLTVNGYARVDVWLV